MRLAQTVCVTLLYFCWANLAKLLDAVFTWDSLLNLLPAAYEIAIFGPKQCFSEAWREFNVHKHLHFLPVAPYSTEASLISQATPFADEACDTNHSLERAERLWRDSFALFTAMLYYVLTYHHPVCMPWAFTKHWSYLVTPSKPWMREKAIRLKSD